MAALERRHPHSHAESGDTQAAEKILPLAYEELRRMASGKWVRERADHMLQPSSLVHEA